MRIDCSRLDKRDYRFVYLDNGLRALLVSKPIETEEGDNFVKVTNDDVMSAACLCICSGSCSDPEEMPGLSNLLCRMLLHGSEKYSNECSLIDYTHKHNGNIVSYVTEEYTCYQFETEASNLEACLNRFAHIFIDPLLPTDAIEGHVKNIDKEFRKAKLRDQPLIRHFIQNLMKSTCPLRKFHKGNMISIMGEPPRTNQEIGEMLKRHFSEHYSGHLMTLAVQSSHNLTELASMVEEAFSQIPKINVADIVLSPTENIQAPHFHKYYKVEQNKEREELHLIWSIPCMRPAYRYNPMLIIGSLIRNIQEGSLAYYLDENFLATDVECHFGTLCGLTNSSMFTLLIIRMNLTPTGGQNINKVCGAVYDYLKYLAAEAERSHSESDLNRWEFLTRDDPHTFTSYVNELLLSQEWGFLNQPVYPSLINTTWLANMMQRVEPQEVYSGYTLIKETNFQFYHDLISRLSKQKICIIHGVPKIETDSDSHEIVPWFETKYITLDVPGEITECRLRGRAEIEFSLPARNKEIAGKFYDLPCANEIRIPCNLNATHDRVHDADYGTLWYQSAKQFENPRATFFIRLLSATPLKSAANSCLLYLFIENVRNIVKKIAQNRLYKRMELSIEVVDGAIELRVSGPSEQLKDFYYAIVTNAFGKSANLEEMQFETLKDRVRKSLQTALENPVVVASDLLHKLTHKPAFCLADQLEALDRLAMADLLAFTTKLLPRVKLMAYCLGDVDSEDVKCLFDRTVLCLNCIPGSIYEEVQGISLPQGSYYVDYDSKQGEEPVVLMERFHFYEGVNDVHAAACNQVIVALMNKEARTFFNEMAHQFQISAQTSLSAPSSCEYGILSLRVERATECNIVVGIEKVLAFFCLRIMPMVIAGIEAMDFQKLRTSLINALKKRFKDPTSQMISHWSSILRKEPNFRAQNDMLTAIKWLTRESLLKYYCANYVDPNKLKCVTINIAPQPMNRRQIRRVHSQSGDSDVRYLENIQQRYLQSTKIDRNALNKYPECQHTMTEAFPGPFKQILHNFAFN